MDKVIAIAAVIALAPTMATAQAIPSNSEISGAASPTGATRMTIRDQRAMSRDAARSSKTMQLRARKASVGENATLTGPTSTSGAAYGDNTSPATPK